MHDFQLVAFYHKARAWTEQKQIFNGARTPYESPFGAVALNLGAIAGCLLSAKCKRRVEYVIIYPVIMGREEDTRDIIIQLTLHHFAATRESPTHFESFFSLFAFHFTIERGSMDMKPPSLIITWQNRRRCKNSFLYFLKKKIFFCCRGRRHSRERNNFIMISRFGC